jgi:transcriptional regulator with GAF, ATPase, and Fis domain
VRCPAQGEIIGSSQTGTGKELIARALHAQSLRRERALISLNCNAIAAGLIESELFGHVKGAFTGAAEHRAGRFRADLFYRLNVFPIDVPPLRERRADIPALAEYFMRRAARKLGKPLERISPATLAAFSAHSWPGNVRDLQNAIERAAVLASDATLSVDWDLGTGHSRSEAAEEAATAPTDTRTVETLEALERSHIVAVLKRVHWVIEGPNDAAHLLGLKPSTMRHRLKKLGISRDLT